MVLLEDEALQLVTVESHLPEDEAVVHDLCHFIAEDAGMVGILVFQQDTGFALEEDQQVRGTREGQVTHLDIEGVFHAHRSSGLDGSDQ